MKQPASETRLIESLEELCAHALELEQESANRFHQLADSMEIHHNTDAANLFRELATLSESHGVTIEQRAAGLEMPKIPPWAFKWNCPDGPESQCQDTDIDYLMTAAQALRIALFNERQAHQFYEETATNSPNSQVRELAEEFAAEEAEHVALLQGLMERQRSSAQISEDLDPPNTPE